MKHTIALFFLAALGWSAGCSSPSGSSRLVGVWEADLEALNEEAKKENGGALPALQGMAAAIMGDVSVTMDLKSDGSWSTTSKMGPLEEGENGTYEVLSSEGSQLRVKVRTEEETRDGAVTFLDADTIRVQLGEAGEPALVFRRKRA